MASFEKQQQEKKKEEQKEQYDRLTAATHFQIQHFSEHQQLEGYYQNQDAGHLFHCDRLMRMENMFGRLQMGYNPNRGKSFIFANIKTSRYDTAASKMNTEAREYEMKSLQKGNNENRVFVSKHRDDVAVLLEKSENKPWTEYSVRSYLNRGNMQTLSKVMPFLQVAQEKGQRISMQKKYRELLEQTAQLTRERSKLQSKEEQEQKQKLGLSIAELSLQKTALFREQETLETMIYRKQQQSNLFFRRINYAFDYQKHEMFEYYKSQRKRREEEAEQTNTQDDQNQDEED